MNINSLDQLRVALEAATKTAGSSPANGAGSSANATNFGSALNDALKEVSDMQNKSAALQKSFETGDPAVSLEQTMVAMQKSQVGFQAAVTVRNRLVAAYTEIMNMPV